MVQEKCLKKSWLKTFQIWQITNLKIQGAHRIPSKINAMICSNIIIKLLKTKGNEKSVESRQRKMMPYLQTKSNLNDFEFLTRNHRGWKEVEHFKNALKKEKKKKKKTFICKYLPEKKIK